MEIIAVLVSCLTLAVGYCTRPQHANCPDGTDLRTGVRRDGHFACHPTPVGDPDYDGTWGKPERSVQASWVLEGRVYCTGNTQPVVEDWRTVGCR